MIKKSQQNNTDAIDWITALTPETYPEHFIHAHEHAKNQFLMLLCNKKFLARITTIREHFEIPSGGFLHNDGAIEWAKKIYGSSTKKRSYFKTLTDLLSESKISQRWENVIHRYVLFNKKNIDPLLPPPFETSVMPSVENADENMLVLRIFEDTTLDDIKFFWPEIEKHKALINRFSAEARDDFNFVYTPNKKGGMAKKFTPKIRRKKEIPNLALYYKIFEMHQNGATNSEIAKKMTTPDKSYSYNDISKLLDEIKYLAGKIILY